MLSDEPWLFLEHFEIGAIAAQHVRLGGHMVEIGEGSSDEGILPRSLLQDRHQKSSGQPRRYYDASLGPQVRLRCGSSRTRFIGIEGAVWVPALFIRFLVTPFFIRLNSGSIPLLFRHTVVSHQLL